MTVFVAKVQVDKPLALGGGARRGDGIVQGVRYHTEQIDIAHVDGFGHGGAQVGGDVVRVDVRGKRRERNVDRFVGAVAAHGCAVVGLAERVDALERFIGATLFDQGR